MGPTVILLAAPATPPAAQPATRPATPPAEVDRRKLRQLARKALEAVKAGRLEEAEAALAQALITDPNNSTNLYNMACVKALRGRTDAAMDYLERAAGEGFTDFVHLERDTDLTSLRQLDRYKKFVAQKGEWQRKAAENVISMLRKDFGEGYLYEVDEADKLIFATNTDAQTLVALKKWLSAQARSQWAQLFDHKPDQYISIILPSAEDYKLIVSRPEVGGFYNPDNHILIAQRLGQIMTHEFTHAMHAADLEALGQEHPIWLTEGLATLYEAGHFDNDVLLPAENYRLIALKQAATKGRLIPFEKLLKMDQRAFVGNATIAYGESGSLLLYLYSKDLLRKFYDTYKRGYDKDKTGAAALVEATGMPLAELENEWRQWMLKRTPPTLATGQNGVVLGVKFGQGNDGLKVEQTYPLGPAARAGIKVGDVVVGIGDIDARDQQSFMPLLALHRAGETVTIQLRRGQEYLSVPVILQERGKIYWPPASRPSAQPATRPAPLPASRR
ncbi:MAG TPA: PDZ domain-containing protein [Tepidisphaeraceae bacterium]|nr:PDZ domain-containing protein [Tepidisphaeraceae bacterium]